MPVYAGKYLRINLTDGTWREESIAEADVRRWLLGSGFAAKLYYDEMNPPPDPLSPDNPLYIFNGVLTGTFAPTGCRSSWCGRSPLTGIWNEANLGNYWGAELRFAGYDGLVITGRAPRPVYLWLGPDGDIELRDASHLWGKNYFETADTLLAETDSRAQVAGIGRAGEKGVKFAAVMSGPSHYTRAAGRGGMGALMGSKNLKAIVVRGKERPQYPNKKDFLQTVKEQTAFIKENSIGMSNFGTAGGVIGTEKFGDLPMRNWTLGSWETAEKISGQTLYETLWVKHTHCYACPIGCGKEVEVPDGPFRTPRGEGIEYETLAGFGGMTRNDNLEAIARANSLCNDYGLDTISTSSAIAFAMEAFEKEIISVEDTGGLELRFGDPHAIIAAVQMIGDRRTRAGDDLAEGVREAARRWGDGAEDFAVHVKGLEVAYHDPRAFVSMAVNYATANRGGCHLEALSYWNGYGVLHPDLGYPEPMNRFESGPAAVKLTYDYQNFLSVYNPLGLCKFIIKGNVGPERTCQIVNRALGWDWDSETLLETGDRLFQLKRLINLRLGVTPADDTLPRRLLSEPRPSGSAAGILPDLAAMLPIYYRLRDWNEKTGAPGRERLQKLGIV